MAFEQDPIYLKLAEATEEIRVKLIETIEESHERMKAWTINNVILSKLTQERKQESELKASLADLCKKGDHLEKICANFSAGVTISDSDMSRLETAKEMYEVGKHLTGVRFDFSAPPSVCKGYVKYERLRSLTPFEVPFGAYEQLWTIIDSVTDYHNKENHHHN